MPQEPEEESSVTDILDEDLPGNDTETSENPETPEKETAPAGIDYDKLAQTFGNVLSPVLAQNKPKPEEPKLTKEQAEEMLKSWKPSPEFLTKFHNVETAPQALLEMRDGFLQQNVAVVQAMMHQMRQELEERYSPLLAAQEQARAEKFESSFKTSYPQLADEKFAPIIGAVLTSLTQSGKTYKNAKELSTDLAKGVETVVQRITPDFKLTGETSPQKAKPSNPNALPAARVGGKGNNGVVKPGTGAPSGKNFALSILDGK